MSAQRELVRTRRQGGVAEPEPAKRGEESLRLRLRGRRVLTHVDLIKEAAPYE